MNITAGNPTTYFITLYNSGWKIHLISSHLTLSEPASINKPFQPSPARCCRGSSIHPSQRDDPIIARPCDVIHLPCHTYTLENLHHSFECFKQYGILYRDDVLYKMKFSITSEASTTSWEQQRFCGHVLRALVHQISLFDWILCPQTTLAPGSSPSMTL